MALGEHGEAVDAVIVDDRHQDRMIGRVRAAVVGRIVQEGIAALQLADGCRSSSGHDVRAAQDVDRQALGGGEQLVIGGQHDAGEVMRDGEDARAAGAEERVRHLPGDAVEAAVSTAMRMPSMFEPVRSPCPAPMLRRR